MQPTPSRQGSLLSVRSFEERSPNQTQFCPSGQAAHRPTDRAWSAGFTWDGMIHKITPKQWDAMLAVHCTAPFRLIQVGRLVKQGTQVIC